jgi:hypothetical protein
MTNVANGPAAELNRRAMADFISEAEPGFEVPPRGAWVAPLDVRIETVLTNAFAMSRFGPSPFLGMVRIWEATDPRVGVTGHGPTPSSAAHNAAMRHAVLFPATGAPQLTRKAFPWEGGR